MARWKLHVATPHPIKSALIAAVPDTNDDTYSCRYSDSLENLIEEYVVYLGEILVHRNS